MTLQPFGMRVIAVDVTEGIGAPRLVIPDGVRARDELKRAVVVRTVNDDDLEGYKQPWKPPEVGNVIYYIPNCNPPVFRIGEEWVVPYEAIVATDDAD